MKTTIKVVLFVALLFWFIITTTVLGGLLKSVFSAQRIVLKPEGETYSIAEEDALEEVKREASKVNKSALTKKILADAERHFNSNFNYPHACKNATFSFYPLYTLDVDVKDEKGNVIYPKGYTFNPLDYVPFPYVFVFFDGTSKEEVEWVAKNFKGKPNTFVVTTRGNVKVLAEKLEMPVYPMTKLMEERFRIKRTPSVVRAVKNYVVVQEVGIHECFKRKQKSFK